jgi:Dynamin central region
VREGGKEADIEEVKNLVRNVIKRPSCLILLVISCDSKLFLAFLLCHADCYQTADIENQGARRLAKEVDRSGHRTIRMYPIFLHCFTLILRTAVLTKPDRIATREHSSWLGLLSNSQEYYRHGWHCVKQSDQQQLESHISWQTARENELSFFENTDPWNDLDPSLKSRLGTRFLTDALGRILFELICKR